MTEHNYEPVEYPPAPPEEPSETRLGPSNGAIAAFIAIPAIIFFACIAFIVFLPIILVWLIMGIALSGNGGTDRQPEHTEQTSITTSWEQQTTLHADETHFTIRK